MNHITTQFQFMSTPCFIIYYTSKYIYCTNSCEHSVETEWDFMFSVLKLYLVSMVNRYHRWWYYWITHVLNELHMISLFSHSFHLLDSLLYAKKADDYKKKLEHSHESFCSFYIFRSIKS